MNETRMIQTLAAIEDERYLFAQKVPGALGFNMGDWFDKNGRDETSNVCGTVACLAGHACVQAGYSLLKLREHEIAETAARYLGLDTNFGGDDSPLFYLDNLSEVYDTVAEQMGVEVEVLRDKVQAERRYEG